MSAFQSSLQRPCGRPGLLPLDVHRPALPGRRRTRVAGAAADLPPPGPVVAALKAAQRRQPGSPRGKQEDVWSLEDAAEMGAAINSEKELGRRCGGARRGGFPESPPAVAHREHAWVPCTPAGMARRSITLLCGGSSWSSRHMGPLP